MTKIKLLYSFLENFNKGITAKGNYIAYKTLIDEFKSSPFPIIVTIKDGIIAIDLVNNDL